jgi:acetylornithine deacetylase
MIDFLLNILNFDSTSGSENNLVKYIHENYNHTKSEVEIQETENGRLNIFFKYGEPKIIFCSHLDTVPPYIAPVKKDEIIYGRGSCDAKGQIAYLFEVYKQLIEEGHNNIGMLMVSGEEDGSWGARRANKDLLNSEYIFVGEPTENKLIKASKGNLLVNATFKGKNCHSGYPEYGDNAIERMFGFFKKLDNLNFEDDPVLGKTTYNIGRLESENAQNVVSDLVKCKIFFRTTFATNDILKNKLNELIDNKTELEFVYGDEPIYFHTVEGFETNVVSYGTDAPEFKNIKNKILYGPGSILNAHTENEFVKIKDLYKAIEDVKLIYKKIVNEN